MTGLDAADIREAVAHHLAEFAQGRMSGKELVNTLTPIVGGVQAATLYDEAYRNGEHQFALIQIGSIVEFQHAADPASGSAPVWRHGRVVRFYGPVADGVSLGVVVQVGSGLELPFSMFEIRLKRG